MRLTRLPLQHAEFFARLLIRTLFAGIRSKMRKRIDQQEIEPEATRRRVACPFPSCAA